jgi:septal ring factor EnvC (AmiA/AmiB activator)
MHRSLLLALALIATLPLSGCVFWQIRDGVRDTNGRLDTVDQSLGNTNSRLDQVNSELKALQGDLKRLDTTNAELLNVQGDLGRLDTTNASLTNVQARLETLQSINQSLGKMDVHLSSLRKTIGRIDGMIPFLDLGTDEPVADPAPAAEPSADAAVAVAPTDAAAPAPAPADGSAPAPAASKPAGPKDALLGPWIRQFPDRTVALVFQDAGRYLMQTSPPGQPRTSESGTWKREGKAITLTSDPVQVKLPDGKTEPRTTTRKLDILTQTTKSLTLNGPEDGLLVFTKP